MSNSPAVKLGANHGHLRLRWTHNGDRYCLGLNLNDSKTNRLKAQQTILEIEADLEQGCFDLSLARYKPHKATGKRLSDLTVVELFEQWLHVKSALTDAITIKWYRGTVHSLNGSNIGSLAAGRLTIRDVSTFAGYLVSQKLKPETCKRKLENLTACFQWGVENGYLRENPFKSSARLIKPVKGEKVRPFTEHEVEKILVAFQKHSTHCRYFHFVEFLFLTGCRTGEGIGLKWSSVATDSSTVCIREQLTRGIAKSTKTKEVRTVVTSKRLRELFESLKRPNDGTQLVFSINGNPIDLNNFRSRVWKPLLEQANVPYRTIYNTRATFVSHCLQQGINPVAIAAITGHDVKVLFDHYAGLVTAQNPLPELF